ncbi:MAG: ATP-binding protein [Asticcacaulis sp.]
MASGMGQIGDSMDRPLRLKRKYLYMAMFAVLSFALAGFSSIVYQHYERIQKLNDYALYQYEVIRQSRVVLMDLVDMETSVRGYLISGDKSFVQPYQASRNMLNADITILRNHTFREEVAAREVYVWLDRIRTFRKVLDDQVENKTVNPRSRVSMADLDKQRAEMDQIRRMMETSIVKRLIEVRKQIAAKHSERSNFIYTIIIGNVIIIGILLMGTLTIVSLEGRYERSVLRHEQAEKRYREVIEGINDGLFEYNFVTESLYCSPGYKALLGYKEHEFESSFRNYEAHLHPDDRDIALGDIRRYVEGDSNHYNSIFRMRHKNGHYIWILARGVGVGDDFSAIKLLVGTHADITDQKEHEEELKQVNGELETFTYITSHDLRSPLVNLKGFSRELELSVKEVSEIVWRYSDKITEDDARKLKLTLDTDIPEALGFIAKGVERMDSLTKGILDLSRIGRRVFRLGEVDAQAVFDKCKGALGYDITQKQIEITCQPLPVLVTDALALEQIFGNLLDNAVKYLRPDVPGRIDVTWRETSGAYVFTVADNGRGIDEADRAKIFEIFRRARNTDGVTGLGLGMAYVKATLRRLSGGIWFESALGEGTRFHFRLPKRIETADIVEELSPDGTVEPITEGMRT